MFRLKNERGGAPAGTVSGGRERARRSMIDGPPSDQGKRTNLGRGLAALFGEENEDYASLDKVRSSKTVPIEHLRPGRFQPRHHFDEAAVDALAASIKAQGIRSEEHTSELQSLMRTSYAVFCL